MPNRCVFIRINQAEGKNKNGPTKPEYRDVPKTTAYTLGGVDWPFKKVRKWAKNPAKKPVINITSDW